MAQLSAAALETSLNGSDTNRRYFQVTKSVNSRSIGGSGTTTMFYVTALTYNASRTTVKPGTSRWCTTTDADITIDQRNAVYTAMAN